MKKYFLFLLLAFSNSLYGMNEFCNVGKAVASSYQKKLEELRASSEYQEWAVGMCSNVQIKYAGGGVNEKATGFAQAMLYCVLICDNAWIDKVGADRASVMAKEFFKIKDLRDQDKSLYELCTLARELVKRGQCYTEAISLCQEGLKSKHEWICIQADFLKQDLKNKKIDV